MTTCVTGCTRPTSGDQLCTECAHQIKVALHELIGGNGLIANLELTVTKQDRIGTGAGSPDTWLPFNQPAAQLWWDLANTITTCADNVWRVNQHLVPPSGDLTADTRWLIRRQRFIATHPHASELHDEITHITRRVWRLIDRPASKLYAGPCDAPAADGRCPDHLYARPGASTVVCGSCGTEHDVAEKREHMIGEAAGMQVPVPIALGWARLLLDHQVPRGTWDSWVSRKRLLRRGTDRWGRALYRFGDVRDLVLAHLARQAMKTAA